MNAVRAVSGCRVRTRGIEAALRDLIAQGSCCIAQPHGQRRTAVTVKRMTSRAVVPGAVRVHVGRPAEGGSEAPYTETPHVLAVRGGLGGDLGGRSGFVGGIQSQKSGGWKQKEW